MHWIWEVDLLTGVPSSIWFFYGVKASQLLFTQSAAYNKKFYGVKLFEGVR